MNYIIFDIETAPLPEAELLAMMPPFDPAEVKTGNIKDPEKIAAKIIDSAANHKREFVEDAALDAVSGRVLAVGLRQGASVTIHGGFENEAAVIASFWAACEGEMGRINTMIGFNSNVFDLPFLIRRSWKLGLRVPAGIRHGRYWGETIVDLRETWQLGDRMAKGSLDAVARHLGVGQKSGDGKDFASLWVSDREAAVAYLKNDLDMTFRVAKALGVPCE